MKDSELHSAVQVRFEQQIETARSLATIYDNDPARPPADGSIWCRFSVRRSDSEQVEAGPGSFRKHGRAYAQLFGPLDKGTGELLEMADEIVTAFEGVTAARVRYGPVTVRPLGDDGSEYQVNVEIPFMTDAIG